MSKHDDEKSQIGKLLGYSAGKVRKWARRLGVSQRPSLTTGEDSGLILSNTEKGKTE